MKRYLILCLLLALLLPCMIVPASATTQGVIDAIEDQTDTLGEYLGVGFGDLRDLLQSIWDSLVDTYQLIDGYIGANLDFLASEFATYFGETFPKLSGYIKELRDYFFTRTGKSVMLPKRQLTDGVPVWNGVSQTLYLTGFEYSLFYPVEQLCMWFCDVVNAIMGDMTASDKFEDEKAPLETQVDEWIEELETAPTLPEAEIGDLLENTATQIEEGNPMYMLFLTNFMSPDNLIVSMPIMFAMVFALVGYLLYGKRY